MATTEKFKTGDRVVLMSGGPAMTVVRYEGDEVICQWFHNNKLEEKAFHQGVLREYEPPKFF